MNSTPAAKSLDLPCNVAGAPISGGGRLEIRNPYNNGVVGCVALATRAHTEAAIQATLAGHAQLTRYQRSAILDRARQLFESRREEFAQLIMAESGLCIRDTRYETGRASDVLRLAAMEALRDDGQVFSCDISPQGKARKIFPLREPLALVAAITPFNHPLNQVVHKLAPA